MKLLYPAIRPYHTQFIQVSDKHRLYVEESGDPRGIPVLFVHGGPGAGTTPNDRRFFDPEKYRIILFDQRGAGRSIPHAHLEENRTQDLLSDMELLRSHLNIDRWVVFGGSWGSTLALLYAQSHGEKVLGLILRGIFLCRDQDIQWFYQEGASRIFPDYWQHFLQVIPKQEHNNIIHAYHQRLTSDNELHRMAAAKAWSIWEARCASLDPNHELVERFADPHTAVALARIEAHYFHHKAFLEADQILNNIDKIAHIPGVLVHGRYDMVCPIDQAVALSRAWPNASLKIIRDAGHAASEPGITDALVRATDQFADQFSETY